MPDSRYPRNHFMLTGVEVEVPRHLVTTRALLDSLLRHGRYYAYEAEGEPAMPKGSHQLVHRSGYSSASASVEYR